MPTVIEGNLRFQFPAGWRTEKFDGSSFYRNQFQRVCGGAKAVDILALGPDRSAWFIEIKDFRAHPRQKSMDLVQEVAAKVRDSLAAVLPASVNANDAEEKEFARGALTSRSINVVLHLEQPAARSRLFPREFDLANVRQKLRQLLKPVDAHLKVVGSGTVRGREIPWTVE